MGENISRKEFLKTGPAAAAALSLGTASILSRPALGAEGTAGKKIRLGLVGTGNRGRSLLSTLLAMPDLEFPALCDVDPQHLALASDMLTEKGYPKPQAYTAGPEDYRRLMRREDLDAVVIASPWHWHTPMAVEGMRAGKYVAVEVPAALTFEQCWELVDTHEQTGTPCMMLENWSFRRDNLAVLNMIRKGLLGEIVHCHCAHSHDCIDHWFFNPEGVMQWGGDYLLWRNADQYPTHSLGPVLSWMDIGCGDYFEYVTSTASRSLGINSYFRAKFGQDHPNAKRRYCQGDIVTSVVKTKKGNTIVINYDMQLPRPYDNRWQIQGTLGLYNEQREAVYLHGVSPQYHEWEPFAPYQEKYEHHWWKPLLDNPEQYGHGGTDYLELQQFLAAVRNKTQTPIDVYDSVIMSALVPLSEASIARGSAPVECPDFTRGKWKTKSPAFAI